MPPPPTVSTRSERPRRLLPLELQQFEVTLFVISVMIRGGVYVPGNNRDSAQLYAAVCHVAAVLRSRTAPRVHWRAALDLFVRAERIWMNTDGAERAHLRRCIAMARRHLGVVESELATMAAREEFNGGAAANHPFSSSGPNNQYTATKDPEPIYIDGFLWQHMFEIIDDQPSPVAPPAPASSGATVDVEELVQCAICLDDITTGRGVLEMPCKHQFHASCIFPWLDRNNSCPLCRYELDTAEAATSADVVYTINVESHHRSSAN